MRSRCLVLLALWPLLVGASGESPVSLDECPPWLDQVELGDLDEMVTLFLMHDNLDGARCAAARQAAAIPAHPLAVNNLAFTLIADGEYETAEVALRQSLADFPESTSMLQNLAVALSRQGSFAEAVGIAEELMARDPSPCTSEVLLESLKLRAGEGDPPHLQKLLVLCRKDDLWDDLSAQGLMPPRDEQPICIPIYGIPDERSVCPDYLDERGCRVPGVMAVPNCQVHAALCDEHPYLYNFRPEMLPDPSAYTFGTVRDYLVWPLSIHAVYSECPAPPPIPPNPPDPPYIECSVGPSVQPERSVQFVLDGERVISPELVLDPVGLPELKAASARVVFPLFAGRVIHPTSTATELGCPPMSQPFYHFDNEATYLQAVAETLAELDAAQAFDLSVSISASALDPQFVDLGGSFQHCPDDCALDLCRCANVQTLLPAGSDAGGVLPPHEECDDPYERWMAQWENVDRPSSYDVLLWEFHPEEVRCDYTAPELTGEQLLGLAMVEVRASRPGSASAAIVLSAPGVPITFEVTNDGSFGVDVGAGPVGFGASTNPFKGSFDVKAGVGPKFSLGGGVAEAGISFGLGYRGSMSPRSLREVYMFANPSVCLGGVVKFGKSYDITQAEMQRTANQVVAVFGGEANHSASAHSY